MMGSLVSQISSLEDAVGSAAVRLQEMLAENRNLWSTDPLFEVVSICSVKYGRVFCTSETRLDMSASDFETYLLALEELKSSPLKPMTVSDPGFIILGWSHFKRVEGIAEDIARSLSRQLEIPIIIRVLILGVSDKRGHLGYWIRIGTCTPHSWNIDVALYRYLRLLENLLKENIDPFKDRPEYCECPRLPACIDGDEFKCMLASVAVKEMNPPPIEDKTEEPSTYMLLVDDEVERLYPANPDAENKIPVYTFLPEYEPPWPCPNESSEVIRRLGGKVISVFEGEEAKGIIAKLNESLIMIECGSIPANNYIRVLQGARGVLLDLAKLLAEKWALTRLGLEPGNPYLHAIRQASSIAELIEAAFDYESE